MSKIWTFIVTAFTVILGLFTYEKRRADNLEKEQDINDVLSESRANSFSHIQEQLKEMQDESVNDTLKPDTDYSL